MQQYDNNRTTSLRDLQTVERPGFFPLTSRRVYTRKFLLTSMGMFGDINRTICDKYLCGLSFVKLLTDSLVASRHIASF